MEPDLELQQAYDRLRKAATRHRNAIDELEESEQQLRLADDAVECLEERRADSASPVTTEKNDGT